MNKFLSFSISFLMSVSALAEYKTLSNPSYLNKLSMALRGYAPSIEEYSNLQKASADEISLNSFLNSTITSYIKSHEYSEKMVIRMDNLMFLNAPIVNKGLTPKLQLNYNGQRDFQQYSATENLIRAITRNNLSWDTVLTGKSYKVPMYDKYKLDASFFDAVTGNNTPLSYSQLDDSSPDFDESPKYLDISLPEDDVRVAGVVTTKRFFNRYTTTALNKNRRRAAAIFRIFLCDSMSAAIPEIHDTSKLQELIFPINGQVSESQIRAVLDDKHGTQEDCMKCHYKLDPLGTTLRASPLVLHETPSGGSLVYKRTNGEIVNKPARGIGEVAKFITQQPEYEACQVSHFWNWFIGTDISLTPKITEELVAKFNQVGRKTNDFVSYLVTRPEFKTRKESSPLATMTSQAKYFLQRCDSCHSNQASYLPAFAKWPIGTPPKDMKFWLRKISAELDLDHMGANRTMPPEDGFRPSKADIKNIKAWIDMGAPNELGNRMVTP